MTTTTDALPSRRANRRFPVAVDVSIHSESTFYTGLTEDLSMGGVFVSTHSLPRVGDRLTVLLRLHPYKKQFSISGIVRWVRTDNPFNQDAPPGFGLAFEDLSPRKAALIQDFLERHRRSLLWE